MTHQPKYVLIWNYDHYAIVNDDANFIVGRVHLDAKNKVFQVRADLGDDNCLSHVGVVGALSEAISALANFYEKNPPQWKIENSALWRKETQYAFLRVERDREGRWRAYRDHYPMLRGAKPAEFGTDHEARSAADAHLLDFYPGHEPHNDGLSWLTDPEIDWRSDPQSVENGAVAERLAKEDEEAMTMQRIDLTMQRVRLLRAAKAALDKNASAPQRRAISSRVVRTNGLVKDRIIHELDPLREGLDARAMQLLRIRR
jgi:hypothetical protein